MRTPVPLWRVGVRPAKESLLLQPTAKLARSRARARVLEKGRPLNETAWDAVCSPPERRRRSGRRRLDGEDVARGVEQHLLRGRPGDQLAERAAPRSPIDPGGWRRPPPRCRAARRRGAPARRLADLVVDAAGGAAGRRARRGPARRHTFGSVLSPWWPVLTTTRRSRGARRPRWRRRRRPGPPGRGMYPTTIVMTVSGSGDGRVRGRPAERVGRPRGRRGRRWGRVAAPGRPSGAATRV